jgi:hypothetical protein
MEAENAEAGAAAGSKRFRSEIEFPYADLPSAVELASTIHEKAGSSCEADELAAWMGQTASGGTFRTRVSAARMFGLVEHAAGRVTLTQLGRDILPGSGQDRAAKVTAFLKVELFSAMYDQYKGNVLPPPPAIERQMEQFGVSPKQKERARQTFSKSATYAGFIDQTTGRFVKPGIAAREEPPPPPDKKRGGGGDDGDDPPMHPLIRGLVDSLPKNGETWELDDAVNWLEAAAVNLRLVYKFKGSITVSAKAPDQSSGGVKLV